MTISLIMSLVFLNYEDSITVFELSQVQAFELVKVKKNGSVFKVYLKDRKESLDIPMLTEEDYNKVAEFLNRNAFDISRQTTNKVKEEAPW